MDVEGDASRLLANFYLQQHDAALSDYVHEELGGEYLRYADNMLILVSDQEARYRGLVKSGIELHRLGLSVNSGKVLQFDSFDDYDFYWAFDLFHKIGDGKDSHSVNLAADIFFAQTDDASEESRPWRQDSVLRRLLSVGPNKLSDRNRVRLAQAATSKDVLATMNDYYLHQIYSLLPETERPQFVTSLYTAAEETSYTQQLLYIRAFLSALSPPYHIGLVNRRIDELADFYRFHHG
jgi:hypothetical protein